MKNSNCRLVEPNIRYKHSFLDFINDVEKTGYESIVLYKEAKDDFEGFVISLINSSNGIDIKHGYIPCSSFWLLSDHNEVIGVIRIRHRLDTDFLQTIGHIGYEIKSSHRRKGYGTILLELGLAEALKIGLDEVLITCNEDNIASIKMIERFRGVFRTSFVDSDSGKNILQFRVDCRRLT